MSICARRLQQRHLGGVPGPVRGATIDYTDGAAAATLSYSPPASDGGSPITGYLFARDDGGGADTGPWSDVYPASTTSLEFLYLKLGTYHLSVTPLNAYGQGPTTTLPVTVTEAVAPVFILANQAVLGQKRTWAHHIPQGLADYSDMSPTGDGSVNSYGELYPLDLVEGGWTTPNRPEHHVPRAMQAGITGVQILQFSSNKGSDFVDEWMDLADPLYNDSDPNNNFLIAPCLEIDTEDDVVRMVQQYAAVANGRPSAARIDGKYVIYVYGTLTLTPAQWSSARSRLASAGVQTFFVAEMVSAASQYNWTFAGKSRLVPYITPTPCMDAWFMFEERPDLFWQEVIDFVNQYNLTYAGGMMPGYDRENMGSSGGYTSSEGTARYRRMSKLYDGSGVTWNNAITWGDLMEHSEVRATSDWNKTRADITAFYDARLRGISYPRPQAELYVTTSKYAYVGDVFGAEAMVLNASSVSVTVKVQLYDQNNQAYGAVASQTVAAHDSGDATTSQSLKAASGDSGKWFRAKAQLFTMGGELLQEVMSAPLCVYAAGSQPSPNLRRIYYSIPSYAALPSGKPSLTISGSPVTGNRTATVTAPQGTQVRFSEVLQNTRQVGNGFAQSPYNVTVPMGSRNVATGTISASANGFYVARVIDEQERVGYSDPLHYN